MQICKTKDYDDMSRKAANIIAAQVTMKPDCVLGLATGSSPIGTYKELIARYNNGDLDFSKATSVNLDEYKGLPGDNDQSYRKSVHSCQMEQSRTHTKPVTHTTRLSLT